MKTFHSQAVTGLLSLSSSDGLPAGTSNSSSVPELEVCHGDVSPEM